MNDGETVYIPSGFATQNGISCLPLSTTKLEIRLQYKSNRIILKSC